jgi:hypothetical protein
MTGREVDMKVVKCVRERAGERAEECTVVQEALTKDTELLLAGWRGKVHHSRRQKLRH